MSCDTMPYSLYWRIGRLVDNLPGFRDPVFGDLSGRPDCSDEPEADEAAAERGDAALTMPTARKRRAT